MERNFEESPVDISSSSLILRVRRLRWQAPILAFFLVLVHQLIEHTWLVHLSQWQHFATQLLFYGLVGPTLAWWALTSLLSSLRETALAERQLRLAHVELNEANERLGLMLKVNRRLAAVQDEDALVNEVLELPLEVLPAIGCSLIRFDAHGQPQLAIHRGDLDPEEFDAWVKHLSTDEVYKACNECSRGGASCDVPCPLLLPLSTATRVKRVHCLDLVRGSRQFGVLTLYLSSVDHPTQREHALLKALAIEISLAFESLILRSRDLATLLRVQQAHKPDSFHNDMERVLEGTIEALEVDGGAIFHRSVGELGKLILVADAGLRLGTDRLVSGLVQGAIKSGLPVVINDLSPEQDQSTDIRALVLAPMLADSGAVGCMVLWSKRPKKFSRYRVQMVTTVAAQAGLLLENRVLHREIENQAALAERGRLAREIHDGLAQTLAYLQLRTAQINNWFEQGETVRAHKALGALENLINEAYTDAREAIDGLRIDLGKDHFSDLISKVIAEFRSLSDIPVYVTHMSDVQPPFGVQLQLLRIIQEALGNIRKHSGATRTEFCWQHEGPWYVLQIADDGRGFDPDDVPPIARHGVRIMRERAELLDAEFQIASIPGAGTRVMISLPQTAVNTIEKAGD